ncbi:MAG TPA: FISUMP domain-containing protein [Saprospiraceae bacterium]|nr:FISUMP domain-containing protein [Saprospiraceae bacterium]
MNLRLQINFIIFLACAYALVGCDAPPKKIYTDSRDGQTYSYTVLENGTKWMTQNLNYDAQNSICGENDKSCKHGRFYSWEGLKEACPTGWHVPNHLEWKYFIEQYGCCDEDAKTKNVLITDANRSDVNTSNKPDGSFRMNTFWSSSQYEMNKVWSYIFVEDDKGFQWYARSQNPINDDIPLARCRCISREKGDVHLIPLITPDKKDSQKGIMTDLRDGRIYSYKVMKDGKKWMTKNLNFEMADSYCYDNNEVYGEEFGRLYSWKAALKACPKGWHLPSDEEWISLANSYGGGYRDFETEQYIGDATVTFNALMEGGEDGFNPNRGGFRDVYNGNIQFKQIFRVASYWSSSASTQNKDEAWNFQLGDVTSFRRNDSSILMGFSCRCVEN